GRGQQLKVARAARVARFPVRFVLGSEDFLETVVVLETLKAFFLAQDIDVSLRKHGAKPGGKFAAAMKMMKQRDATEGGFPAIERGVQGIGKFARVGVSERAPSDCGGSGVKKIGRASCRERVGNGGGGVAV